jgi:hypothetical protein
MEASLGLPVKTLDLGAVQNARMKSCGSEKRPPYGPGSCMRIAQFRYFSPSVPAPDRVPAGIGAIGSLKLFSETVDFFL